MLSLILSRPQKKKQHNVDWMEFKIQNRSKLSTISIIALIAQGRNIYLKNLQTFRLKSQTKISQTKHHKLKGTHANSIKKRLYFDIK